MYTTMLASILAFSAAATAAPLVERQAALSPWEVTGLAINTPSGRPGSWSVFRDPWSTITANVTDPNELVLGTSPEGTVVSLPAGAKAVNCQAKWLVGTKPTGRIWPCENSGEGDGYWGLEIIDTPDWTTTSLDIKIIRAADTLYQGSQYKKTFAATEHFQVGQNLGGQCGGSGVCYWGLAAGHNPTPIQPAEV